jgi:chromosome partitioning protein
LITIAICSEKGGVGRTTIAVNLAASFARCLRVLVLDCDPQNNCKICLGFGLQQAPGSLIDVLLGNLPINDAVLAPHDNIRLLESGGGYLFGAITVLQEHNQLDPFKIKKALDRAAPAFDVCLIDTSKTRNLLSTMAVCASDWILIPCAADDFLAVAGTINTANFVDQVRAEYGLSGAQLAYVVTTFLDRRSKRSTDEIMDVLRQMFTDKLSSPIRINSRLRDCPGYGQSIYELGDRSGIDDFDTLTEEVLSVISRYKTHIF